MPRVTLGPVSLEAPDDWTLSTVILAGPLDKNGLQEGERSSGKFQRNFVVTTEQVPADTDLEDYVRRQEEGLVEAGVETTLIGEPEDVSLAGGRAWGRLDERVIVGSDGQLVRQMQLVTLKSGIAFTMIASHLDGPPFERVRREFRDLLLSFQ
jgi:hypothetical protein